MNDDSQSASDPLGQVADEFVAAYRQGKRPSIEEFAQRYPQYADQICEMLPTIALMEKARSEGDGPANVSAVAASVKQLGDYLLLREVGRGGMGVVYEAQQLSLGRHVALKVLPSLALLDARQLGRFHREARAAAKLHHTNIVPVFGVGEQDGVHYYVMQFIQGLGLDAVLRELRLQNGKQSLTRDAARLCSTIPSGNPSAVQLADAMMTGEFRSGGSSANGARVPGAEFESFAPRSAPGSCSSTAQLLGYSERSTLTESGRQYWQSVAQIGIQVADALAHAASHGILHRDIKPSNLLLDDKGNVWVTDFGLAKAESDTDNITQSGDIVGTLRYMAPERLDGHGDIRSDVYSLGLTLYEMLTLRPAFDAFDRHNLAKQIMHDEPARPRRLNRSVPRDLETVVLKAMARDPAHRYQTPSELADDLKRFAEDRPIRARRVSEVEKFRRWCHRNPLPASLLAAVAILLVGVATISTIAAIRISHARDEATRNARAALAAKEDEAAQRKIAEANAQESRRRLVRLHVANGERLLDAGDLLGALPWLTEALRLDQDEGREEIHRTRLAGVLAQAPRLVQLCYHDDEVQYAAFSPDGRRVVTASSDHTARVWDVATGTAVTPPLRHEHIVWKAEFSLDGTRIVTVSHDGTAQVWDAVSGKPVTPPMRHDAPLRDVAISPDGSRVATAGADKAARVWDAVTGEPVGPPLRHAQYLHSVAFSPDGRRVVTASNDGTAQIWDAATGVPAAPPLKHGAAVKSAVFSPNGRYVVTASEDHTARIWDAATSAPVGPPLVHGDALIRAAFSPDGNYVSTTSFDTTARVWDAATGQPVTPPLPHRNSVRYASFSPDSRYVATCSYDHTARVWEVASGTPVTPPLRHGFLVSSIQFSPDGRRVVTASGDRTARVWDIATRQAPPLAFRQSDAVNCAVFSPDGRFLATASTDQTARIWDTTTGRSVTPPLQHGKSVEYVAFSPNGCSVVTASGDGTAQVWDAHTGEPITPPLRHEGWLLHAVFDPKGERVLTSSMRGTAQVWDARTGEPLGQPLVHSERVFMAFFSPDGSRIVTASGDGTAQVWDAKTGKPVAPPLKHAGAVESASFSPDGQRVVTASADNTARVWDAATGKPLTEPLRHGAGVAFAWFSPDGRRVVTGSRQGTARVWHAATGAPVTPLLKAGAGLIRTAFSPDGRRVATGGGIYGAQLWDAETGASLSPPLRQRGWAYHVAFSPDGHQLAVASAKGVALVWQLPLPDTRPLDDLVLLAQVLSGQRVDATDGLVEVDPDVQFQALKELRARYPDDFGVSRSEVLAWHRREAEACQREQNAPAAMFHLLRSGWAWPLFGAPPPQ